MALLEVAEDTFLQLERGAIKRRDWPHLKTFRHIFAIMAAEIGTQLSRLYSLAR